MKVLLMAVCLLSASAVWAMSPEEIGQFCAKQFSIEQYRASCMQGLLGSAQTQEQNQLQRELARQQATGMALFGSGNALINGMNQGLQNTQIHPYVLPPAQHYSTR